MKKRSSRKSAERKKFFTTGDTGNTIPRRRKYYEWSSQGALHYSLDHSDERGFSFSLENLSLRDFHIVSLRPGTARGDHAHEYVEVALVIGGAGCAEIELGDEDDVSKFMVDRDFYPVTFPSGVKHTIRNVGRKVFFLVCFSTDDPGQQPCVSPCSPW